MTLDERFNKQPRSWQTQLQGLDLPEEQEVNKAKYWIDENPSAFNFMVREARRLKKRGKVSANYLVKMVQNELRIHCKDQWAAIIARIIETRYPDLKGAFKKSRSKFDGYC